MTTPKYTQSLLAGHNGLSRRVPARAGENAGVGRRYSASIGEERSFLISFRLLVLVAAASEIIRDSTFRAGSSPSPGAQAIPANGLSRELGRRRREAELARHSPRDAERTTVHPHASHAMLKPIWAWFPDRLTRASDLRDSQVGTHLATAPNGLMPSKSS